MFIQMLFYVGRVISRTRLNHKDIAFPPNGKIRATDIAVCLSIFHKEVCCLAMGDAGKVCVMQFGDGWCVGCLQACGCRLGGANSRPWLGDGSAKVGPARGQGGEFAVCAVRQPLSARIAACFSANCLRVSVKVGVNYAGFGRAYGFGERGQVGILDLFYRFKAF